jgi:hypothetical protein
LKTSCVEISLISRGSRRHRTRYGLFVICSIYALLSGGCQSSSCPENRTRIGDMVDKSPRSLCERDSISFSPSRIDTCDLSSQQTADGDAGMSSPYEIKISIIVRDSGYEGRDLVNLDIYECDSGEKELNISSIGLKGVTGDILKGSCVPVSNTRIHCLTDDEGRASFALLIWKSSSSIDASISENICADTHNNNSTTLSIVSSARGGTCSGVGANEDSGSENSEGGL